MAAADELIVPMPNGPGNPVFTSSADLGAVVLIPGEDRSAYDRILARVNAAVAPSDIIEEFWVRDVVDLIWDTIRLRRLKASLLAASAYKGLENLLEPLVPEFRAQRLAERWNSRDASAITEVEKILRSANLTMDSVMAETLSIKMNDVERIDRMITASEMRRIGILREVDRHRDFSKRLRDAAEKIGDAEFAEVAPDCPSLDGP